jgi:hypothetical protein
VINGQGQELSRQTRYFIATPHANGKIIFVYFNVVTLEDKLNKSQLSPNSNLQTVSFKNLLILKINK